MSSQKHIPPASRPLEVHPIEFSPTQQKDKSTEKTLEKIDAALDTHHRQWEGYWTCSNWWLTPNKHCGCEDSTDNGYGAGGKPGAPVYVSKSSQHWCKPAKCDKDGNPWFDEEGKLHGSVISSTDPRYPPGTKIQ